MRNSVQPTPHADGISYGSLCQRGLLWLLVFILVLIQPYSPVSVVAADGVPNIDAVLVLDASNSMKTSDPHQLSIEAMKMFIDMLSPQGDKVGVVSYTDQIERAKAMTAIRGAADKETLKDFVSQLKHGSYTDITVGLDEALRMMDDAHEPGHKPVIIMLTDGNIELDARKGKTMDDASRDTERIIAEARDKSYPIYTIGLNYDGYLNRQYLENIAEQTGGLCFETKSADDLPDLLSAIFADQMEIRIVNAGTIQADGDFQSVTFEIPDHNIVEANVTFLSGKQIELELYDPSGQQIPFDTGQAILTQSNFYSLLKIMSPQQGSWALRVKGVSGDQIKINLLYHYSIDMRMEINNLSPSAGDTVQVDVTLLEQGRPTANDSLYTNSVCTVTLMDVDTGSAETINATWQNGLFTAELTLPDAHTYQARAKVEHPNFFRESDPITITASATPTAPTTPTPTAKATSTPSPQPEPDEESGGFPWPIVIGGGLAVLAAIIILWFVFRRMRKTARVFTGKLILEVTDNYTHERSAPQYRNLIEYGSRTNLLTLLGGGISPSLSGVQITASPTAPSHMPQIIVKCANPQIKFRKDFMEQDASKGIPMNLKSELTLQLEAENKLIKLRYTE